LGGYYKVAWGTISGGEEGVSTSTDKDRCGEPGKSKQTTVERVRPTEGKGGGKKELQGHNLVLGVNVQKAKSGGGTRGTEEKLQQSWSQKKIISTRRPEKGIYVKERLTKQIRVSLGRQAPTTGLGDFVVCEC